MKPQSKRTTFTFDEAADRKLTELAARKGTNKSEILRRAIIVYDYLEQQEADGHVKLEKPSGEKVEIILP